MTAKSRRLSARVMVQAEDMNRTEDHEQRVRVLEFAEPPGRFVGIIFPSTEAVASGDDAGGWFLVIPEDLDGAELFHAHAGVYTPGTAVELQVRNVTQATDMLTDPITIDSGHNTSYTSGSPPVIDEASSVVAQGDIIVVDVDDGGGAEGLDIILAFA